MRKIILFIITIFVTLTSYGQGWTKILRKELFDALIDPSDSIYIETRKQLERVKGHNCSDSIVTFNYTTTKGDKIEIQIEERLFDLSKHKLDLIDTVVYVNNHGQKKVDCIKVKNIIDGKYSYGIDANMPISEIKSMTVKWNGHKLIIPNTAYSNLYQPHLCLDYLTVEPYLTIDNKNLYIYIYGSDGAGAYSVKFVFDQQKYLTRIIGTNEMTNGFDFLDGTAKVDD